MTNRNNKIPAVIPGGREIHRKFYGIGVLKPLPDSKADFQSGKGGRMGSIFQSAMSVSFRPKTIASP